MRSKVVNKAGTDCLDDWQDKSALTELDEVESHTGLYRVTVLNSEVVQYEHDTMRTMAAGVNTKEVLRFVSTLWGRIVSYDGTEESGPGFVDFVTLKKIVADEVSWSGDTDLDTAIYLSQEPRLSYLSQSICTNEPACVIAIDINLGWTPVALALAALAGLAKPVDQGLTAGASMPESFASDMDMLVSTVPTWLFRYGPETGCHYAGIDNSPLATGQNSRRFQSGIGFTGDGRYSDRKSIMFKDYKGNFRRATVLGQMMFLSGLRRGNLVDYLPINSLSAMGFGATLSTDRKRLDASTTAMFDIVVNTINRGHGRLAMWYVPKALSGEIAITKGKGIEGCYFKDRRDIASYEYGPTVMVALFKHSDVLAYLVNVGIDSYVLAAPYDQSGFRLEEVGKHKYHLKYERIPDHDRFIVEGYTIGLYGAGRSRTHFTLTNNTRTTAAQ